jgi:hypothetical protein
MVDVNVIRLSYPIGKNTSGPNPSDAVVKANMESIKTLGPRLRKAVEALTDEQLDTPYREGGWTVRQVVHHLADSHMNAYIRTKLALTEDTPIVKPYMEAEWAKLPDSKAAVDSSLNIIDGLHKNWTALLDTLDKDGLQKSYMHPELNRTVSLRELIGTYGWHSDHHLAHITTLRDRMGW